MTKPDGEMDEAVLEAFVGLLSPLLRALEILGFVARHFHPPQFDQLAKLTAGADQPLRAARPGLSDWPERLADVQGPLAAAADSTLAALDDLAVAFEAQDLRAGFQAMRHLSRAQEALYPLADAPPISRYFLEPSHRDDGETLTRLTLAPASPQTGVMHFDNERGSRGGFSLYVPEYAPPEGGWPLVMALHGGSGHGRAFLWSWLRAARTLGAIVATPTSVGGTWALSGPDPDTPNLARILELVQGRWPVDGSRLLLTGMSDGGTFAYVSGLEGGSPFTHLAPVSAAFHPMLAQFADAERLTRLPIRIVHGALDWMFQVEMAREAARALSGAGAQVSYVELEDLSHCYPQDQNAEILEWLGVSR